ncbi:MAG: hypothetical protein U5L04_16820 [Trueperaceae bacterium]|nr:hypothetical protein [Trueperaceae bacterium]
MSRTLLGNRGSVLALRQARAVLSELNAEWPDVRITQRTLANHRPDDLLEALQNDKITIALQSLETLPLQLPEGLVLAAVTKRLEARYTLIAKGDKALRDIPGGALIGVSQPRDEAFLRVQRQDLETTVLDSNIDDMLERIATGELGGVVLPVAHLIQLERRHRADQVLEVDQFPPAVGQGSLGLVVRKDDFLASELAYTLHHRPSYDRTLAERSFAQALAEQKDHAVGTYTTIATDGTLTLFGAIAEQSGAFSIQAEVSGEASEAKELGKELAADVLEQLKAQSS